VAQMAGWLQFARTHKLQHLSSRFFGPILPLIQERIGHEGAGRGSRAVVCDRCMESRPHHSA
jgi:hypothetical protein